MDDSFSIYDNLPEESELAFLYLDDIYHEQLSASESKWRGDEGLPASYYVEYMSKVLAAKTELQLNILADWARPQIENFSYSLYLNFRHDVVHYRTAIQIRFGRRVKTFSVRLDANAKSTIRHYTAQIRELILKSELPEKKKEALLDKLAAFENEVDRYRTRMESFGAAFVEFAGYIGDAIQAADIHRLASSIAKVLHGAKEDELKELPRPTERKQLEPPKKQEGKTPSYVEELDDEIPF